MAKIVRASKRTRCLVCDGAAWPCYYFENREVAGCKNVVSDKADRNGLFLHVLVSRDNYTKGAGHRPAPTPSTPRPEPPKPRPVTADAERLSLVFEAVLNRLMLSGERRSKLLARGLDGRAIERGMYRDTPTREEAYAIVRLLEPLGLDGVPGFYRRGGRWRMLGCYPGTFVPYRNVHGRILGLSYRLYTPVEKTKYLWLSTDPEKTFDGGSQKYPRGTKLTPPLHFAGAHKMASAREILLTEGALKADVASHLLGLPVIAAGGVTQWGGEFAERFKRMFPSARAAICYDADWRTNPHVRAALERLMADLGAAGVRFTVRSWPRRSGCKGIDDLALALSLEGKGVLAA